MARAAALPVPPPRQRRPPRQPAREPRAPLPQLPQPDAELRLEEQAPAPPSSSDVARIARACAVHRHRHPDLLVAGDLRRGSGPVPPAVEQRVDLARRPPGGRGCAARRRRRASSSPAAGSPALRARSRSRAPRAAARDRGRAGRRSRPRSRPGYSTTSAPSPCDRRRVGERPRQRGLLTSSCRSLRPAARASPPAATVDSSTAKNAMLKNSWLRGHALDHGERGEHHRDRAAQPGPAEHTRSPAEKCSNAVATNVASGRAMATETNATIVASERHVAELAGEHEQPEREEHRDLGHPREPLVEREDRAPRRDLAAAQHQPGEVDGEEARPVAARPRRRRRSPRSRASRPGTARRSRAGALQQLGSGEARREADREADRTAARANRPPCRRVRSRGSGSSR